MTDTLWVKAKKIEDISDDYNCCPHMTDIILNLIGDSIYLVDNTVITKMNKCKNCGKEKEMKFYNLHDDLFRRELPIDIIDIAEGEL